MKVNDFLNDHPLFCISDLNFLKKDGKIDELQLRTFSNSLKHEDLDEAERPFTLNAV